jgi:O-antigen ligase
MAEYSYSAIILTVFAPFIALKATNIRRVLLTAILIDLPLQADINLGHNEQATAFGSLSGWNVSIMTAALAGLYALWFCEYVIRSKNTPVIRPLLGWPLILYIGFGFLSVTAARNVELSYFELFLLVQVFFLFLYISCTVRSSEEVLYIFKFLLLGMLLECMIVALLVVVGHSLDLAPGITARLDPGASGIRARIGGTIGDPNGLASYYEMLLAATCGVLLAPVGSRFKQLAFVAFGLGGLGLIQTFSRGGWLSFGAAFVLICVLAAKRGLLPARFIVLCALAFIVLFIAFGGSILARTGGDDNGSTHARGPLMTLAFDVIQDNWLFGVGPNNFAIAMQPYITSAFFGDWIYTVHNKYLLVWAETGIGGLTAFVAFLIVIISRGITCWRRADPVLAPLALGLTAAVIGRSVHMFVDLFSARPQVESLWFTGALITAMYCIRPERSRPAGYLIR